jgi:hypothetical protein
MARATVFVVALACLAAGVPAAHAAGGCEVPKRAHVKASARHVVAYTRSHTLYACLDSSGKRVKVKELRPELRLGPVVAAGSKLAYTVIENAGVHASYDGYARVRLVDLRHHAGPFTAGWVGSWDGPPTIERLVLAPDGALAYSVRWFDLEQVDEYHSSLHEVREVRAHDDLGSWRMAEGSGIDLRSLAHRGRVVSWTDAGARRSKRFRELGKCRFPREARLRGYARGVTVYDLESDGGDDGRDDHACIAQIGEDQLIHRHEPGDYSFDQGIAGHFVAWAVGYASSDEVHVSVYDLDVHGLVHDALVEPSAEDCGFEPEVRDVAVSRQGDVAWTTEIENGCGPGSGRHLVTALDACGRIVLDDDPQVQLYSLRRFGRMILWEVGTEQRSFELRSAADC